MVSRAFVIIKLTELSAGPRKTRGSDIMLWCIFVAAAAGASRYNSRPPPDIDDSNGVGDVDDIDAATRGKEEEDDMMMGNVANVKKTKSRKCHCVKMMQTLF